MDESAVRNNILKPVYIIIEGANTYDDHCYESYDDAVDFINKTKEYFPDNTFRVKKLSLKPLSCAHCGHHELMTIPGNEPYSPTHYQCDKCDSTYIIEDHDCELNEKHS